MSALISEGITKYAIREQIKYCNHIAKSRHICVNEVVRFQFEAFVVQIQHQTHQCMRRETGVRVQN